MKQQQKRHFLAASIAMGGISALGILHIIATHRLMELALGRKEPALFRRERDKLLQSESFQPLAAAMAFAPDKLKKAPQEEVTITADDGTTLVGHWHTCRNPRRVIVAMHGWRSSWSQDFGAIADFLKKNQCCVLYAEQRGQGESGGDCMGFGLTERHDCLQWVRWINERTDSKLPLYLCGISMGGTTVLMAAGGDLPKNVCGVIADCAFTSPTAIWEHVARHTLHVPYGLYKKMADDIYHRKTQIDAREYSSTEAMKACHVPVLFIHGTADRLVPVEMTYENYMACAAKKHLLVVPGADHGMSYHIDRPRYEQALIAFWQSYDGKID